MIRLVLLACGAAFLASLVIRIGPGDIAASLSQLSWSVLLIVVFPFSLVTLFDTMGWRFAFRRDGVPFRALLSARMAGEAFNLTTPTAAVGGEAVKAWLLRPHVPLNESLPSVIVAKTTITIAQGLFLLVGVVLAWPILPPDSRLLHGMAWLLGVEVVAVGGFVLVQMMGLVGAGGRVAERLGALPVAKRLRTLAHVDEALSHFYRRERRRFLLSIGSHFVGWVLGVLEAYIILRLLGAPVPLLTAAVIEAFGTAVRFAAFVVPAGLGAQEGGHAAVFAALGLGAGMGVSFSLVRRVREAAWVGFGLVALASMRPVVRAALAGDPEGG
jgi:putative membrane protein